MTIAAGFVCADGIVIAADTEYTGGSKFQGQKVWWSQNGDTTVVLTGAGPAIVLGHIRDHVFRMLEPSMEPERVSDMVHGVLTGFFEKHIYSRPAEQQADLCPSFLFAVRKGRDLRLYQTQAAPPPARVDTWACVGYGSDLGQYIADLLYKPGHASSWTERLAAYLVYQAKRHSPYCGGGTDVVTLARDAVRPVISSTKRSINELELFFDSFHAGFSFLLVAGLDERLSDETVDHQVERFRKWLGSFRRAARASREQLEGLEAPPSQQGNASTQTRPDSPEPPKAHSPVPQRSRRGRTRPPPSQG